MKKKSIILIAPLAVVAFGLIGYLQEGTGFYQALLSSLDLLKVVFDPLPPNPWIEAARWIGILFFFSLAYAALSAVIESGFVFIKTRNRDAVAVHGDSVYAERLLKVLGKSSIKSTKKVAFMAPRQVIIFEKDSNAVEFYQKHSVEMKKAREVYLCLDMDNQVNVEFENTYITNMAEIRAIDYWTKHFSKGSEKIAIIGSGQLAEAVLYWGLLTNVSDPFSNNSYLLFGNFDKFSATHGNLKEILHDYGNDNISFYNGEWYSNKDIVMNSDRVILCGETLENVRKALDMRSVGVKCHIHLFAENSNIKALTDDSITVVGTLDSENIKDVVFKDLIHKSGKLCHATYMILEDNAAESTDADAVQKYAESPAFNESWKNLNAFTRGSNYAAAIHDPVKKELLKNLGINVKGMTAAENMRCFDQLDGRDKDRLQEIEHIRWCRYHLLNNWKKPENGIVIDRKNKLHHDLVPYDELPAIEQVKDSYLYSTLALRV